ncbi:hypothetical protein DL96DRAFT_1711642 [Flagelloscypha sp. PMI_526]|nr:hypothetical protein DL96DRAFT_1711642 [Flagelloscypha sp. PMI_526]
MSSSALQTLLDETLGAEAIAFGVSSFLFGILTIQVLLYFRSFRDDAGWVMCVVTFVWMLEFADQCFIAKATYYYTVTRWGQVQGIISEPPLWAFIFQQTFGTIVGTIVKLVFTLSSFFGEVSNRNYFVTGFNAAIITVQFVVGMIYTKRAFDLPNFQNTEALKDTATLALAFGAAADLLVAITLTWYISQLKTGYAESDSLVNRLIVYGLATGGLSGLLSLLTLILSNVKAMTWMFVASFIVLSKVLAMSLMASLNTRKKASVSLLPRISSRPRPSLSYTATERKSYVPEGAFSSLATLGRSDAVETPTAMVPMGGNERSSEEVDSPTFVVHPGPATTADRLEPRRAVFSAPLSP